MFCSFLILLCWLYNVYMYFLYRHAGMNDECMNIHPFCMSTQWDTDCISMNDCTSTFLCVQIRNRIIRTHNNNQNNTEKHLSSAYSFFLKFSCIKLLVILFQNVSIYYVCKMHCTQCINYTPCKKEISPLCTMHKIIYSIFHV